MITVQLDSEQLITLIQSAVRKVMDENNSPLQQTETDEFLTVKDTAKFLSLSVPTVYLLISKKAIPVMKRSKRCYFSKADLISYVKEGRKKTSAELEEDAINHINRKRR